MMQAKNPAFAATCDPWKSLSFASVHMPTTRASRRRAPSDNKRRRTVNTIADDDDTEDQEVEVSPAGSPKTSAGKSGEKPRVLLNTPVVFQCAKCLTILTDSLSHFVEADVDAGTLSVRAARGIKIADDFSVSQSGKDIGCTYFKLHCPRCNELIGRKYSTTTRSLDSIRDAFTFDTAKLVSYQLASCVADDDRPANQHHESATRQSSADIPTVVDVATFDELDQQVSSLAEVVNSHTEGLHKICSSHNAELVKLQTMFLVWEERFQRLENVENRSRMLEDALNAHTRLCCGSGGTGRHVAEKSTFPTGGR